MATKSVSWRFGRANIIACCVAVSLLAQAHCQATEDPVREFTTREDPGLQSVDYIIIGVASAAVAGSLTLLTVVVLMNRNKQKDKNKVIPSGATQEVRQDEENAIISKSMTAAEDGGMDDDPMG